MSEQKEEQKAKPTPEQVAEMKAKMLKGYQENMEFLKVQVDFEELQARLSEAIARQARAEAMIAQIRYKEQEAAEGSVSKTEEKKETIHRTLKREPTNEV